MRLNFVVLAFAGLASLGGCDSAMNAASSELTVTRYDVRVDRARSRTWRLTSEGLELQKAGDGAAVALPLPGWVVAGPADACPPDLAIGPKGEVVVTSNVISTLWRVDPETLAVSVHPVALEAEGGRDIGFTSLMYSVPHGAFFAVSHAHGAVWKINTTLTSGQKVPSAGQSTPASERKLSCATT